MTFQSYKLKELIGSILVLFITYRKSSKETRVSYSSSNGPNAGLIRIWPRFLHFGLLFFKLSAGLIRMRVLFEGGSLSRIYGIFLNLSYAGQN